MPTSSTAVTGSGKTGGLVPATGPYASGRNAKVTVLLTKGARFPVDTDGKATTWTLVTDTQMKQNAAFVQLQ
jgi:hypothetical protein